MNPLHPSPSTNAGTDVVIIYRLTDRQLADVYYRHRRKRLGWIVRLCLSAVIGGGIAAAAAWLFPPAEQAAFEVVGCGLVLSAVIVAVLRPGQVRRDTLRNVRDNPALLQTMSLGFNEDGLQAPFDNSGTYLSWAMWRGRVTEDATWFYLHLPGVRQPWPVPKTAFDQDEGERFARLAALREPRLLSA